MPPPNHSGLINLRQFYEVEYWTKELSVTSEELTKVVEDVGNKVEAVRTHLGR